MSHRGAGAGRALGWIGIAIAVLVAIGVFATEQDGDTCNTSGARTYMAAWSQHDPEARADTDNPGRPTSMAGDSDFMAPS